MLIEYIKKAPLLILSLAFLVSCRNQQEGYEIYGQLKHINEGTTIELMTESEGSIDTAFVKNQTFIFKGYTPYEVMAGLKIGQQIIKFPLINDNIDFEIENNIEDGIQVSYLLDYEKFQIRKHLQEYMDEESVVYLYEVKITPLDKVDSLAKHFIKQIETKYKNKDDKSGLAIITYDMTNLIGTKNLPDDIENLFNLLPEKEKKGFYGKKISNYLEKSQKISKIKEFNFEYIDSEGKTGSFNDLFSEYTLLEFWASWCNPCKVSIPYYLQLSEEFSTLKVVGVSIDSDIEKWKEAIESLNIQDWTNIHFQQNDINLKDYFSVQSIPYNILFDDKGNVIGENINVNELLELLENQ